MGKEEVVKKWTDVACLAFEFIVLLNFLNFARVYH